MMWFQYDRKTNVFCTVIFATAFINLILQCVWIIDFFNNAAELFQCSGLHYGHVAAGDSIMLIILSVIVMSSADNYSKYMNQIIYYAIVLYQFLKIILEICLFNDEIYSAASLFIVFQPLPFLVFLILNRIKKMPVHIIYLSCVIDYILFLGEEFIFLRNDLVGFFMVYNIVEISISKLFLCIMFCFILLVRNIFVDKEKLTHFSQRCRTETEKR